MARKWREDGQSATHMPEEFLGHAWVTTTQRYLHLEVADLQEQVAELPANSFHSAS